MYPFTDKVATTKKSRWVNPCYGIVIHHTAGGTYKGNLNYLSERSPKPEDRKNTVSVHFVIGPDGECGKIGDPRDILWHAGNGSWGKTPNVNYVMMGIEVVGFWEPNEKQYERLTDLVEYLMGNFPSIERINIIRHSDCTQDREFTKEKILWDGKRKVIKRDIGPKFFPEGFEKWRENLQPKTVSKYGEA